MSAQTYEPLRMVPPLDQQHRIGVLLRLRSSARKAMDAALATPRKAAGYVSRLIMSSRLGAATSWLRRVASRLIQPLLSLSHRLAATGVVAGITSAVTSPTGQKVLKKAGLLFGRACGWLARTVYSGVDHGLRMFGRSGNKAADLLFAGVVSIGGKVAAVAAPVVHRVTRFSDPQAAHIRLLSGVARSVFVHRLLKAFIGNPLVRLLVEGVLLPVALDSRATAWLRAQVRVLRQRAALLHEQAETLTAEATLRPADMGTDPTPVADAPMPPWQELDADEPVATNRAERRAQQRQQQRRHA